MRKFFGVLLLVLGVPILVLGVYAAIMIGPDDTAETGPHRLSSDGAAVVTTPEVLAYVGPTLHLKVTRTDGGPVFVGVGPQLDVTSYLGSAAHREITDLVLPWKLTSAEVGSDATALSAPGEAPWWLAKGAGDGSATLVWPIVDGRYQIVATNADGSAGVSFDVVMGLELDGAFYGALAVVLVGLLLVLLGLLLLLWKRLRRRRIPADLAPGMVGAGPEYPSAAETAVLDRPGYDSGLDTAPFERPPAYQAPARESGTTAPTWPFNDTPPAEGTPPMPAVAAANPDLVDPVDPVDPVDTGPDTAREVESDFESDAELDRGSGSGETRQGEEPESR